MTVTLTEFLLARLGEDERDARIAGSGDWASWSHGGGAPDRRDLAIDGVRRAELPLDLDEHICRWDPARVLAECEAKRRIVDMLARTGMAPGECDECGSPGADAILERLALPYADHPDYRQEWRP